MAPTHEKSFKFKVDDSEFETSTPELTGQAIKLLAQVPPANQLFLEVHGKKSEDQQIKDDDTVDFSAPGIEKLYSVPPATFGRK